MMAMFDGITLADGTRAPLWELLPGEVTLHTRLAALGPQSLDVAGHVLRGHTFHYSTCASNATVVGRTARPGAEHAQGAGAEAGEALYRHGSVHASYFHAWFPSSPKAVAHLFTGAQA
jgi:cobyrinic acid a,c-diamide synthase